MTREEAKVLLPIIQAFAEGKTIEYCNNGNWVEQENFGFMDNVWNYRIKPRPKYRPFKDAHECWEEMRNHQPFGWVKIEDCYDYITEINNQNIIINNGYFDFELACKDITFADGTPFGIRECKDFKEQRKVRFSNSLSNLSIKN